MIARGAVWWGPAPHKSSPAYRPWLVVNDDGHPFADEESIVLGLTTTNHSRAIAIPDDAWVEGGSNDDAYVSPWYVTTIKHRDLDDKQGRLDESLVDRAVEVLHDVTGAD
ncbi:MAG: type II toxin-antitoxin system PemK/MazF family toxin [Halococcoides sp.]